MSMLSKIKEYFKTVHTMTEAFRENITWLLKIANDLNWPETTRQRLLELDNEVKSHAITLEREIAKISDRIDNKLQIDSLAPCDLFELAHQRHMELKDFWRRSCEIDYPFPKLETSE